MKDLFDMVAGTSTGGLLTSALVAPSKEDPTDAYYSDTLLGLFEDSGPEIFKKQSINSGLLSIMIVTFIMIGGVLGYKIGKKTFANPKVEDTIYKMKKYIRQLKKSVKRSDTTADSENTNNTLMSRLESAFQEKMSLHFSEV